MNRPHVRVFVAASLDGFIADAQGDLSWLSAFDDPPELTGYARLSAQTDTFVFGRNTYDAVLGFGAWPYAGKRVVVLTHRGLEGAHGESAHAGSLNALLDELWTQGSRNVYLDGGQAIRQGLLSGCVDELTISWAPVVLGTGVPLFGSELPMTCLQLLSSRSLPSGLVQCVYAPKAGVRLVP
ncbi:dihydrofolate reductase family protein [Variovorax sp. LT1R16]|uniref:dihydrofolate reductase family protein n=1 Tax=Variovorax sp. LT1R16 TaxID=3443728 RepID=UPI003F470127